MDARRRRIIRHPIVMGDSLEDRRTWVKRPRRSILYGLIPSRWFNDMTKFPYGRFTNGYTWDDLLCELLVSRFLVKDLEAKEHMDKTEIADELEAKDPLVERYVQNEDTLDNDRKVDSEGERFARTYCEGGLTAHDCSSFWTWNWRLFAARKIVSTLEQKRNLLLADDKKLAVSAQEKAETLIIEGSGGNDLMTVNDVATIAEADRAVAARMENVRILYANGYRNFALLNLPNLACTPRFFRKTQADRDNVEKVCKHFNDELAKQCALLQNDPNYSEILLTVSDAYKSSTELYEHPEAFGLDPAKRNTPLYDTLPPGFDPKGKPVPGNGSMWSDEIHPSAEVHAIMAKQTFENLEKDFDFRAPPHTVKTDAQNMFRQFMEEYRKKIKESRESWTTGRWTKAHPPRIAIHNQDDYTRALAAIIDHGLNGGGSRTWQVMKEFGWLDENNNLDVNNPALAAAKAIIDRDISPSPPAAGR